MANLTAGSNPDGIEIDHEHPETHTNQDNDNLTTIQVTPTSHMPDEPTTIQETPLSQMPEASPHQLTTTEQPNTSTLPAENETESHTDASWEQRAQTTETTIKSTPHPTMNLTIEEFPIFPSQTPEPKPDTQETPDIADFFDDSMEPSPEYYPWRGL